MIAACPNNIWPSPAIQLLMLQFVCDYCGNVKQTHETWINGVAVENVGTQAARREVIVDPAWRYERAILPLAVHFCCVECKDRFLAELFQKPMSLLEVDRLAVEPDRRLIRARKKPVAKVAQKRAKSSNRSAPRR
jgi:hypothetical protein